MALVNTESTGKPGEVVAEYRSREHVWATDERSGNTFLKYAPGDPIPEDEARRQGLVAGKKREPEENKAVREPKTKAKESPMPDPVFDANRNRWAAASAIPSLTDNSGGTPSNTIADVPAIYDEATFANIVASLAAKVNAILAALREDGTIVS